MLSLHDAHNNLLKTQYATWKVQPRHRPEPKPAQSQCVLFVPRLSTASASLRHPGTKSGATMIHSAAGSSSSTIVLQSSSMPALRRGATTPSAPRRKTTQRVDPRDAHTTTAALEHPSKLLASFSTSNQCRCQLSRRLLVPGDDDAAPTPELAELMRQCGSHFLWCPLACDDARLRTLVKAEYQRQLLVPVSRRDVPRQRR